MRVLLIGIAAAGLVGATTAKAGEQPSTSDKSAAQPAQSQPSQTQSPADKSMDQAPASPAGTTASASKELSGVVKKVDKDKRSLKISSLTGGDQELKVADSATITRDGTQAGLDQIKEGDQVRASFDSSGNQASKIEVTSKQKADKSDMKTSDPKTQTKDKN
jgi:Cu/Ag efflux protein CusF